MSGGKSSSSSNTTTENTTSSATSTGVVGDVLQGQYITVTEELPDAAVDVFKQLVDLVGQSIDVAAAAGEKAIDTTTGFAEKAAQPDLSAITGYQKQVYWIIGAIAVVGIAFAMRKK